MTDNHGQWAERLAYLFGGAALISLSQAAYALTIVATLLTIVLACVKLHDRIKYGPYRGRFDD